MEWLDELKKAIDAEKLTGRLVGTLATVDGGGLPRARSVVCRRIDHRGALWVTSDARSSKNGQLRGNPHAEFVVWLPGPRLQFRVQGEVRILGAKGGGDERMGLWRDLSDTARALFFWPAPGAPKAEGDVFPPAVPADRPAPDTFEVLILSPDQVERLDLKPQPHVRRRWRRRDDWRGVDINP
jgi:pyridoxamine 5'-phosphate oxidase